MNVLEIGTYVVPAYAGMLLAEQGHHVVKWCSPSRPDPIQALYRGQELWAWINEGKSLRFKHAAELGDDDGLEVCDFDVVIDNVRPATWNRWNISPAQLADRHRLTWVSMRDDFDGRSFDAIAQARAWGDHVGYVPAYVGDTTGGLWMAFKALSLLEHNERGHHVLRQAACLAKLVEGELVVKPPSGKRGGGAPPWDVPGSYGKDPDGKDGVAVLYRDGWVREPYRDDEWRRENLRHVGGRYVI
ncbi:CoA transferase [Nonomuraea sp. NPDC050556]|uniref:CoA transferase n=1 Tax=Nonomuraea sp. NPDC050556 TaxID=3364369 RepID=UPI003788A04F